MPTAHDVAAFILQRTGEISAMKLQKLLYYSQAWHLVWAENPLFDERIEAWANGPVIRDVYDIHRGFFSVADWHGDPDSLDESEKESVIAVLDFYGDKTAQWLSNLTHQELPWMMARRGMLPEERGDREITTASMHEYYSSL